MRDTTIKLGVAAGLVAAILGLLYVQVRESGRSSGRAIGVSADPAADGGLVVLGVGTGTPAERGGVRPGDVLVEVDGHPVSTIPGYNRLAQDFRRGEPVHYLLRRGHREVTVTVTPGVPFPWWPFLSGTLAALAYLAVGLLALFQRGEDLRARLLFLFCAAVALELALPSYVVGSPTISALSTSAFFLLTGLQIGLELHLASVIPEPQPWLRRYPWVVPCYYGVGVGLGGLVFVTYISELLDLSWLPWSSTIAESVLFDYGMVFWGLGVAGLLANQALRYPEPRGRHQATLVLLGLAPWVALTLTASALDLAGASVPVWLTTIEPMVLLVYPVTFFIAIYRYQLFDIELVVRRSLVYTALTSTLLLLFYAAIGAAGALFSDLLESGGSVWVVAGTTLLLGLLFTPLRRGLEQLIYRRFFPERLELRQRLTALAGELPALGSQPLMGRHLAEQLCRIFELRWATILIADAKSRLLVELASTGEELPEGAFEGSALLSPQDPGLQLVTRSGRPFPVRRLVGTGGALAQRLGGFADALVAPLISHRELVGLLILGPRRKGGLPNAEDLELLGLLARHVATVFENVRLFESATYESLTGLLRRETVLEGFEREVERARRYARPLSVALADLDHFKRINDRFGHLVGDRLLKVVAEVVTEGLRSTDLVGRYGGEEFLLVLPETGLEGALEVAEKIRVAVGDAEVPDPQGRHIRTTISIGVTSLTQHDLATATVEELIAAADRSLYDAKEAGRNQVRAAHAV